MPIKIAKLIIESSDVSEFCNSRRFINLIFCVII